MIWPRLRQIGKSAAMKSTRFKQSWANDMKNIIITIAILIGVLIGVNVSMASAQAIGHDKYDHAAACYGIEYTLSECKPFKAWKPWQRALFTTAVIGGGKEWYDARHPDKHTAEWGDVAADAVGAFGAEGTLWLVHRVF